MFKPNETILEAASGLNDLNLEDIEIPACDIYTQEFFFYAYSMLTKDRRAIQESSEGYTYIKRQREQSYSKLVLKYLHHDENCKKDIEKFSKKVQDMVIRRKTSDISD
jgi:hypothetical protein